MLVGTGEEWLFTVVLGSDQCVGSSGGGLDPVLDTSDLPTSQARWLELELEGVTLTPRMPIATVPTAAVADRALSADNPGGHPAEAFALKSNLAAVATSGSYEDLADKPGSFPPSAHTHAPAEISGLAAVATSGAWEDLADKPAFSAVATSGSYDDLSGRPDDYVLDCEPGYVLVPGRKLANGQLVLPFCVMKYEARNVGGSPESVASGMPWVEITWTAARAACQSLGRHLLTDKEWLAIANDVVTVASNWTGGAVGEGELYSGHNDNEPPNALGASTDDDPYFETGNSAPSNQRRTLTLSNGEVIWDLSGNVREWTDATIAATSRYHGGGSGWMTYSPEGSWSVATNVPEWMKPPNLFNGVHGMGRYFDGGGEAGATNAVDDAPDNCTGRCAGRAAFQRGGVWSNTRHAGVFALNLDRGRADWTDRVSFRCAYR